MPQRPAMPARRPALVWTKHNSKPVRGIGAALRARRTDMVIAVCDYTRRELLQTAYRRCRLETVYNGVDIERWSPWPADEAKAERASWNGGDDGVFLLGSNAGTASYKGWMDLMEALPLLPPDIRQRVRAATRRRLRRAGQAAALVQQCRIQPRAGAAAHTCA